MEQRGPFFLHSRRRGCAGQASAVEDTSNMLERFLSAADTRRATRILQKLARNDVRSLALSGGLATELHHELRGSRSFPRALNDIDFIVESFGCLPDSLADDFLFRHVHPLDPPNKTILQAIDPVEALRVDVFRACGESVIRSSSMTFGSISLRLVSLEDLVARSARLALDVTRRVATPRKHATDFLRLLKLADVSAVESVWRDHRRPDHPATFREAKVLLQTLLPMSRELLIAPSYSTKKFAVAA
jgi:hypothetical protein